MIRQFFSREWAKLKEMTFEEKRWYIWEYYKLHIFILVLVLFIAGSIINNIINPPRQDYLYVAWQADLVTTDMLENLSERLSVIVDDPDNYAVSVRMYTLTDDPQMNMALITRFHAMLSLGEVHVLFTTGYDVYDFAEAGITAPLDEVLAIIRDTNPALYGAVYERLITITFTPEWEDEALTEIMGIHMGGSPLLAELGFISDDLYFGIVGNAHRPESTAELLRVFFQP